MGHGTAGDDERLHQRQGELMELYPLNGHASGRRPSPRRHDGISGAGKIEEAQLTTVALEQTPLFQVEHPGNEALLGIEYERMERALRSRSLGGGVLREGKLEEGVKLYALAPAAGVFEDLAPGADVPGADQRRR
jgi:hypothetical protein